MRFTLFLLTVLCLCAPFCVQAGPWLRDKGSTFTSVSITTSAEREFGTSSYLEYGVSRKMTIGADVGSFLNRAGDKTGSFTVFMRRSLGAIKGAHRLAYELGVGTAWQGAQTLPHIKAGLSWGRSITLRDKSGWMNVDGSLSFGISHDQHVGKIDATLGLNFTDKTTGMLQLYLAHQDSKLYSKLVPSIVIRPRDSKFRIQIGTELPLDNMKNAALKLGIWRNF